jgi:hypothetical protein
MSAAGIRFAAEYAGGLPKAAPAEAYIHAARITILAAGPREPRSRCKLQ